MAAPTTRRRRRAKPGDGRTLTAAATVLPAGSKPLMRQAIIKRQDWQLEALDFFDSTPELKYAGWWVANLLAKVKLYVAIEDANGEAVAIDAVDQEGKSITGVPTSVIAQAKKELDRLKGPMGGRSELQRVMALNLDFAGECYLVGWAAVAAVLNPDDPTKSTAEVPESWEIRSVSEVEIKQDGSVKIKASPEDQRPRTIGPADTIIRVYQRHPRWMMLADSHVRATITQCRILQVLEGQILAESMSRHNAGILLVKSGTTWSGRNSKQSPDQQNAEDPFTAGLVEGITAPISDPNDVSSVVPNIALVEDVDKAMKKIELGRDTGDALDKRIEARIDRLAGGLNVPKEVVLGHRSTTFSNADQIADDEFTDHLEPRVLLQCDVVSIGFLRPQLREAGGESAAWADRLFVWYDATGLVDPPEIGPAAEDAFQTGYLKVDAYLAAKGFAQEDRSTPEEQLQILAMLRGVMAPATTNAILETIDPTFHAPDVQNVRETITDPNGTPADAEATAALIASIGGPTVARLILQQALGMHVPAPIALPVGAARSAPVPPR